ncbi:uncharacterized protein B0H18DRAFT_960372 [Fomitopsis serialis]|uniref:uncharacterized protein n=1 Tax=Fomitopsis serialis TaxID=139415 RepID=UPI0020086DD5|nr:uncharacterized protein B0H18DRAFT_960372 [Neoantrodia serialis]KAH9913411.1 hypothetical protein B0H18DRAFT_960372 [Neoantrodia serialis]
MAPPRWTTAEEAGFLQSKVDAFRSHQLAQNLQRFWPTVYREWFSAFPEKARVLPGVDGELSEDQNQQLQKAIQSRQKQIYNWFNNLASQQNRKAKSTRVNTDLFFKSKSRRSLKDTEVYSRMYYDERVKPLVEKEIAKKKVAGHIVARTERLQIIKDVTVKAFDKENETIKAEVRAQMLARQTMAGNSTDDGSEGEEGADKESPENVIDAVMCQAVLDDLPAILRQLFLEIYRRTGWYFLVLAAGEVPGSEGQIESIAFHQEGDDVEHNIGRMSNFVPQFVRPFLEYVKEEISDIRSRKQSKSASPPLTIPTPGSPAASTPVSSVREPSATPQAQPNTEPVLTDLMERSPVTDPAAVDASEGEAHAARTSSEMNTRPADHDVVPHPPAEALVLPSAGQHLSLSAPNTTAVNQTWHDRLVMDEPVVGSHVSSELTSVPGFSEELELPYQNEDDIDYSSIDFSLLDFPPADFSAAQPGSTSGVPQFPVPAPAPTAFWPVQPGGLMQSNDVVRANSSAMASVAMPFSSANTPSSAPDIPSCQFPTWDPVPPRFEPPAPASYAPAHGQSMRAANPGSAAQGNLPLRYPTPQPSSSSLSQTPTRLPIVTPGLSSNGVAPAKASNTMAKAAQSADPRRSPARRAHGSTYYFDLHGASVPVHIVPAAHHFSSSTQPTRPSNRTIVWWKQWPDGRRQPAREDADS